MKWIIIFIRGNEVEGKEGQDGEFKMNDENHFSLDIDTGHFIWVAVFQSK